MRAFPDELETSALIPVLADGWTFDVGAADYAAAAEAALDGLGDNPYMHALRGLARYAVDRES